MITIICGDPGTGKTSFLALQAMRAMTINARERYLSACCEIDILNSQGLKLKKPPYKHLAYGNFYCISHIYGYAPRELMDFDGTDFGLSDSEHQVKLVPPFSNIFLMEAQSFLDSRKSRFFRQSVSRAYEIHRHYDLDIWLDCQRATLIDLNVRGISERIIEMQKLVLKYDSLDRIIKATWYFRIFNSSEEYDAYLASGRIKKNYISAIDSYDGDLSLCYNTKQNRALFYEDIENKQISYELIEKPSLSLDYIKRFNLTHSLAKLKTNTYWQKGV